MGVCALAWHMSKQNEDYREIATHIAAFFDSIVKGKEAGLLERPSAAYPEAIFVTF